MHFRGKCELYRMEWEGDITWKRAEGLRGGNRGKSTLISSSKVRFLQPKAEELQTCLQ